MSTVADLTINDQIQTVEASSGVFDREIKSGEAESNVDANSIIKSIFNAANIFAGIVLGISIIMIILGGLKYIMANGDQRQAEQGKMVLIYSGIGIIIALSAFVIARLFESFSFAG